MVVIPVIWLPSRSCLRSSQASFISANHSIPSEQGPDLTLQDLVEITRTVWRLTAIDLSVGPTIAISTRQTVSVSFQADGVRM